MSDANNEKVVNLAATAKISICSSPASYLLAPDSSPSPSAYLYCLRFAFARSRYAISSRLMVRSMATPRAMSKRELEVAAREHLAARISPAPIVRREHFNCKTCLRAGNESPSEAIRAARRLLQAAVFAPHLHFVSRTSFRQKSSTRR